MIADKRTTHIEQYSSNMYEGKNKSWWFVRPSLKYDLQDNLPSVYALCCTVLYCTVLYCTVLYCTALYWMSYASFTSNTQIHLLVTWRIRTIFIILFITFISNAWHAIPCTHRKHSAPSYYYSYSINVVTNLYTIKLHRANLFKLSSTVNVSFFSFNGVLVFFSYLQLSSMSECKVQLNKRWCCREIGNNYWTRSRF